MEFLIFTLIVYRISSIAARFVNRLTSTVIRYEHRNHLPYTDFLLLGLFLIITFSFASTNLQEVSFGLEEVMEQVTPPPRKDGRIIKKQRRPNEAKSENERILLKGRKPRHRVPDSRLPKTLQGEFMIDTTRTWGSPSADEQLSPSVAFDGTNYFVVWGDWNLAAIIGTRVNQTGEVLDTFGIMVAEAEGEWDENGPSIAFGNGNYLVVWADDHDENILGIRVDTSAAILDTTPIVICSSYYYSFQPSVTFGDSNFLVVWTEERGDFDIYGTRVSTNGRVLDPANIPICWAHDDQAEPAVIFGDTDYLIVWEDDRGGSVDIYGTRVNTAGLVIEPGGIPISTANRSQGNPAVTFGGGNYFMVWNDYRSGTNLDIYGARVDQSGTVLDSSGIPISIANDRQRYPSVAFDGTNYFAVWEDRREEYAIYGARIDTAGIVLDSSGICLSTGEDEKLLPSIAFGTTNYFVAWTDFLFDGDIYGTRVDTQGTVLDPDGILLSMEINSQYDPKIAFDGTNYLVVWTDNRAGSYDIYGTRVSPLGIVLDPTTIPISTADNKQQSSQIIFGANEYFVIWTDYRNGNSDIYGTRVSRDGIVLDTAGIPIATAADYQGSPQVVFGGNTYFVVWRDYRTSDYDIYGARVNTDGIVLDTAGIPIATAAGSQSSPQVVFGGNTYFVVWQDYRASNYDIYGTRVSLDGIVLEPDGIPISTANYYQSYPQVVYDGNTYFVVWQDGRAGNDDIYGARITLAGVVLEPNGIPISTATGWQEYPQLIFGGNTYFVVWEDRRAGYSDIYGARVTLAGSVLEPDGIPISTANYYQEYPQVVFTDNTYFVVWTDRRPSYTDIYGARVSQAGVVIDSFPVSTQPGEQESPALACGIGNQVFITYTSWTRTYQARTYNAYRIWGKLYPFVGMEQERTTLDAKRLTLEVYPNPFSKQTAIRFTPDPSRNKLKIFDISGKLVKSFAPDHQQLRTNNNLVWDGKDDTGQKLPAGIYLLHLKTTEGTSETKEIIILR